MSGSKMDSNPDVNWIKSNKLKQFYKNYLILIKFKNPLDLFKTVGFKKKRSPLVKFLEKCYD